MENYNQLINKAKFFYKSNEFENAKKTCAPFAKIAGVL